MGPPRVLLVAAAPRGTKGQREKMGAENSLGGSRESHKMPEEGGDKQPLTPK